MANPAKKSKKVKSLGGKALSTKHARTVRGGADLLPAISALEVKTQKVNPITARWMKD